MLSNPAKPLLSIIVPVLNEAQTIPTLLQDVAGCLEQMHQPIECVVVDGGSTDGTVAICQQFGVRVLQGQRGRGHQLALGARHARGEILLFLHADCRLTPQHCRAAVTTLRQNGILAGGFHLKFDDSHTILRLAERINKLRFRLTQVVYGDHGLFIRRVDYEASGGFPEIGVFEDVVFCQRLKKMGKIVLTAPAVVTSARRFRAGGIVRTYLQMAGLHILYWLGVSPQVLARWYGVVQE